VTRLAPYRTGILVETSATGLFVVIRSLLVVRAVRLCVCVRERLFACVYDCASVCVTVRVPVRLCVCVVKSVTNCEASLSVIFCVIYFLYLYDMSPSVLFSATPVCQLDIKKCNSAGHTHFCASAPLQAVRASAPCPLITLVYCYEVIRQLMHDAVTVEDCFFKSARTNGTRRGQGGGGGEKKKRELKLILTNKFKRFAGRP